MNPIKLTTVRLTVAALLLAGSVAGCSPSDTTHAAASLMSSPETSDTSAAPPSLPDEESAVPAGTYAVSVNGAHGPTPVLQVPAGYTALPFAVHVLGDAAGGRGLSFWDVGTVFSHPCKAGKHAVDPGPSVADLARALARQPLRAGSDPVPVTLAGYEGLYLETSVPDAIDFSTCEDGYFDSWTSTTGNGHYAFAPGQQDQVWILDVGGYRLVIEGWHLPGATQEQIDEITTMVNTLTIHVARP